MRTAGAALEAPADAALPGGTISMAPGSAGGSFAGALLAGVASGLAGSAASAIRVVSASVCAAVSASACGAKSLASCNSSCAANSGLATDAASSWLGTGCGAAATEGAGALRKGLVLRIGRGGLEAGAVAIQGGAAGGGGARVRVAKVTAGACGLATLVGHASPSSTSQCSASTRAPMPHKARRCLIAAGVQGAAAARCPQAWHRSLPF